MATWGPEEELPLSNFVCMGEDPIDQLGRETDGVIDHGWIELTKKVFYSEPKTVKSASFTLSDIKRKGDVFNWNKEFLLTESTDVQFKP